MKITFLRSKRDKSKITFDFLFPVIQCKRYLKDLGYDITVTDEAHESLVECDVLCVLSSCARYHRDDPDYTDKLRRVILAATKTYFFDISDSGGAFYWNYFDICDAYYKKQIYHDRGFYTSHPYDLRMHFDFYRQRYGCEFPALQPGDVQPGLISSVKLSWNLGLGDYRSFPFSGHLVERVVQLTQYRVIRRPLWIPFFRNRYIGGDFGSRNVDTIACFSNHQDVAPIYLHRKQARDVVAGLDGRMKIVSGFLKRREYSQLMRRAKSAICPFGWGEITWKDFEMFIRGVAVLKPNMSHLHTWPPYFVTDKTYVPYKWDASDLSIVVESVLSQPGSLDAIAREGQERFRSYDVLENPVRFVERFRQIFADGGASG